MNATSRIVHIGFVGVLGSLAACSGTGHTQGQGRGDAARTVTTEPVMRQELHRVIEVVGTLAAADEVTVASEAVGKVVRIRADLGDRVMAGDVIVELDR